MTDDEFDAIKKDEKKRLRLKKRAASLRRALDRSDASAGVLRTMRQRARGLLDDTTALTQRVLRDVARGAARLEQALDDARPSDAASPDAAPSDAAPSDAASSDASASDDPDAEYRAMQADALVRRMKQQDAASSAASARTESPPAAPTASDHTSPDDDANPESDDDLPDKTIGRYR